MLRIASVALLVMVLVFAFGSISLANSQCVHVFAGCFLVQQFDVQSPLAAFLIGVGAHLILDELEIGWLPSYQTVPWDDQVFFIDLAAFGGAILASLAEKNKAWFWAAIGSVVPDLIKLARILQGKEEARITLGFRLA